MRLDEIAAGRDAFGRQAWQDGYERLRTADEARAQLEAEDLERLAVCAYMVGNSDASAAAWTRAHADGCGFGTNGALRAAPSGWSSIS
jgi:hypothetical protein